jgi:hypothetical protein
LLADLCIDDPERLEGTARSDGALKSFAKLGRGSGGGWPGTYGSIFLAIRNPAQDEFASICDVQFPVDAMQMNFHRAFANSKLKCHDLIREPL